jgi:hypothetical protein
MGVSKQVGWRLLAALQFLGLANSASEPTLELRRFVKAAPQDQRRQLVASFAARYSWILELDSPTPYLKFLDVLQLRTAYRGDVLKRAAGFAINMAQDLGIELPVFGPRRGRPAREIESPNQRVGKPQPDSLQAGWQKRYFDFLMREAERTAKTGRPDPEILDRMERLMGIGRTEAGGQA